MNRPAFSILLGVVALTLVSCTSLPYNAKTHHGANVRPERTALLYVHPSIITAQGKPRELDIRVLHVDPLGDVALRVRFDGPPRDRQWPVSYRLKRNGVTLDAKAHITESKDGLRVALPDVMKGEEVLLMVGWFGGAFEQYRVSLDLTTERGKESAEWIGYQKSESSVNRLCQPAPCRS